ncbi:hypothetical protein L249_1801 [Ophiocordyceps polyrhachis-furcata BCC 54312]|uniref:Glucose receptor Git3-like N-terminal domain-containing protein n=1 Tax=Ophiocordyceps polyrhachis-furcata BCC 54312 TaxID=1330021 RepID=A0A367LRS7_9HYPO|nr:hypothetical protein L249_1801 [Ophiocordyceps polyrhachis-furcata BCC 54312]
MSSPTNSIDLIVAVPTFIGSLLSFIATLIALTFHFFSPPRRHFRHALVINLLVADFINSLNNTISGAITLSHGERPTDEKADAACIANAWIGQFSIQAVDFNILIISIIVLYTVLNSRIVSEPPTWATVAICIAAWIPGLITSLVGIALGVYGYVNSNWCWIRSEYLGLRYGLTHGWRIAIFVGTIAIYTFIYIHLKRVFGRFRVSGPSTGNTTSRDHTVIDNNNNNNNNNGLEHSESRHILVSSSFAVSHELDDLPPVPHSNNMDSNDLTKDPAAKTTVWAIAAADDVSSAGPSDTSKSSAYARPAASSGRGVSRPMSKLPAPPNLKKMLLMNGYPLAYIVLWLPGMINRLAESVGGSSPRWLRALQSSTQFIGFVNAFTYGFSEHLRRAHRSWSKKRKAKRSRA